MYCALGADLGRCPMSMRTVVAVEAVPEKDLAVLGIVLVAAVDMVPVAGV